MAGLAIIKGLILPLGTKILVQGINVSCYDIEEEYEEYNISSKPITVQGILYNMDFDNCIGIMAKNEDYVDCIYKFRVKQIDKIEV